MQHTIATGQQHRATGIVITFCIFLGSTLPQPTTSMLARHIKMKIAMWKLTYVLDDEDPSQVVLPDTIGLLSIS